MRNRIAGAAVLALMLVTLSFSGKALAAGEGTAGDYFYGMGTQLGRGVWNAVSSPAEIPCTMRDDIKDQGGVGAATGFGKGTWYMVRRIIVGVSEIGTFILPSEATLPPVCKERPQAAVA